MKKSKFTEEQIIFALRQAEMGTSVAEVCRKMSICEATLFQLEEEIRGSFRVCQAQREPIRVRVERV